MSQFELDLVRRLLEATSHDSRCQIVLIGGCTCGASEDIAALRGEVAKLYRSALA